MPKLTVDGIEVEVAPGSTVLQACEAAGAEIPRFCYHERLSIAGNCRMCLVEMEKAPKPVASCAMPAGDNMVIKTNTPLVKKAREGVMEFLLINHPLDCPICDQGGECDLQDQAMAYGTDSSRYDENKRAVKEKYMGPLIKTIMTRCIHCTRCVRFADEVAGIEELGATGRGENMEITTYVEKALTSELSGNLVDLCPVGALTSKPYAFAARPWELRKTESVDVMDALGSNIRVDSRGREVMRVLPRLHEDVNEEWISDKTRHACDGLKKRRLDRPYVRGADGKLKPASWGEAFAAIKAKLDGMAGDKIGAIVGDLACAESMIALKDLMEKVGSPNVDCRQDGAKIGGTRAGYLFNSTIAGIEDADAILLVGTNPRVEAPVLNARIRKRWTQGGCKIGVIGQQADLTYRHDYLGAGPETLSEIAEGKGAFAEVLTKAKRPMIVVGMGALARPDGAAVLALARAAAEKVGAIVAESGEGEGEDATEAWNGFNVLHTAASRVAGLDLGLIPGEGGKDVAGMLDGSLEAVFLLGADEIDTSGLANSFVVYLGTHGDAGVRHADVILPGAAYTEKNGTYVNTEGRVQLGIRSHFPPGEAREDWTILRALSDVLGQTLPYDNLGQVRARLVEAAPHFELIDQVAVAEWADFGAAGAPDAAPFAPVVTDFYMTNPIARASAVMQECSALYVTGQAEEATGTDG